MPTDDMHHELPVTDESIEQTLERAHQIAAASLEPVDPRTELLQEFSRLYHAHVTGCTGEILDDVLEPLVQRVDALLK